MASLPISWDVELPERRKGASLGARKPRAQLIIGEGDDAERIYVPVSLGRSMLAFKDSGGAPTSRAELLYELGRRGEQGAFSRICRLVDKRDYTRQEIESKLKLDGYAKASSEAAIERAERAGIIDDARYARSFVRSKVYAGWGDRRIAQELSRRGLSLADVEGWPDEFLDGRPESERALELVRTRRIPGKNAFPKLVRFLCARGYSTSAAMSAARSYLDESGELE